MVGGVGYRENRTAAESVVAAIVLVSSVAARLGAPNEYVDYAASKAALDGDRSTPV